MRANHRSSCGGFGLLVGLVRWLRLRLKSQNFSLPSDFYGTAITTTRDLPYPVKTSEGTLAAIPHSDFTDNRLLRGNPRDFFGIYKNTFDFLRRHEAPSLINLTVHAHFGGRPLMSAVLSDVLHYMKGFSEVWFARHHEIARWVLQQV